MRKLSLTRAIRSATIVAMSRYTELEKVALEYAELDSREVSLRRELAEVVAAKALKVRHLASFAHGAHPAANRLAITSNDAKQRVFDMLGGAPSRIFMTGEVIESLKLKRSTASVYLSELATEGRIRRIAKGKYQALHAAETEKGVNDDTAIPARIVALLDSEPNSSFSAPDIAKRFGESDSTNSIRGALSRLARDGKIEKVSHGKYKALAKSPKPSASTFTMPLRGDEF